jgi:glycosyltransferase involved in cell wall biosynthesis
MKVAGFTFIRNAVEYEYPVVEAIRSVLPICDEFVVAVGNSKDETLQLIKDINDPKIKIIETVWDDSLREGGKVLAVETDKAYAAISEDVDWCFYIQGDECIHEKFLEPVKKAMEMHRDNPRVDGLLFDYLHFYGSFDFIGTSFQWYRKEVRVVRKRKDIYSYRDAQGFRKGNNEKLSVADSGGAIYHYGWVRKPETMQAKKQSFHKLWHSDEWIEKNEAKVDEFDYSEIDALERFKGTHPHVMQDRIKRINWKFDYDPSYNNFSFKDKVKRLIEKWTGWLPGEYKNYKRIKP